MQSQAKEHELMMQRYQLKVLDLQQVLVVQPWYHSSHPWFKNDTTEQLMMNETLSLIRTIGWNIVDGLTLTIRSVDKKNYLSVGQLENIREIIDDYETKKGTAVSAVFLSAYKLSSRHRLNMEIFFDRPVFDR